MMQVIKFIKKHWSAILVALYLISPVDFIPDFLLPVGLGDDALIAGLWLAKYYLDNKDSYK